MTKNPKNKTYQKLLLGAFFLFGIYLVSSAQTIPYKQIGNTVIEVKGTSTLHNWEMISKESTYEATFKVNPEGAPVQLEVLKVSIPAESLKSGKGSMDKNAYSSLKTDKFKTINFSMITSKMEDTKITLGGNLTIAGTTNKIDLEAVCTKKADNSLACKGSKTFKMSEYKVEPPSFMFGSVKTGDEITVSFDVNLSPFKP